MKVERHTRRSALCDHIAHPARRLHNCQGDDAVMPAENATSEQMGQKRAVIIGAGPAGLTAAYEFVTRSDVHPVVFEADDIVGGLSRTVNYRGNRIDIGGHRFFSKSQWVMNWWRNILPVQGPQSLDPATSPGILPCAAAVSPAPDGPDPAMTEHVLLVRRRLSRILHRRKFFDYPLSLSTATVRKLGLARMVRIGISYARAVLSPIRPEKSLQDFLINRFGRELYLTFFKDYTHKLWGVPCDEIKPEWGAQRIKGLSIWRAVTHALRSVLKGPATRGKVETSLIDRFLYPKYGPGQMWEQVAEIVQSKGGELHLQHEIIGLEWGGDRITSVSARSRVTGEVSIYPCDYVISTMPVKELIASLTPAAPPEVTEVASGLLYRDFITIGVLLNKMRVPDNSDHRETHQRIIRDNWVYVQENDVRLGRIQVFNNWSPFLVNDPDTVWLGLEYYCAENDSLWSMPDPELITFATAELAAIQLCHEEDVIDGVVLRMPKAYPAYFGTYDRFQVVRQFADSIENLFLVGRNGMHRYNNQDHSMLTARVAVETILSGSMNKEKIWKVNTEQEYHEESGSRREETAASPQTRKEDQAQAVTGTR